MSGQVDRDILVEEALEWLARLQDAEATAAERAAFEAWLARGPDRLTAWQRALQVWSRAGELEAALRGRRPAGTGAAIAPSRRVWLKAAAAAAVAAAAGAHLLAEPATFADHATRIGERRSIALPDGSTVELGSTSALSLDFGPKARRVRLHRGEAYFAVTADPARPFLVEAAAGRIRALGTAFDVKLGGESASVAVVEHAVEVSLDGEGVRLNAGEQVRYGNGRLGRIRPADLAQVRAWQRDRLIFQDAPLGAVVADLERWRRGRIVITDDRLEALSVTAVFDVHEIDAALQTIADSLPVRVLRLTDLLVLLTPAG